MMKRNACNVCGSTMEKAHRVHAGIRYCRKCSGRCFKPKACSSCGKTARLLSTDPNAICNQCLNSRPCVRCHRINFHVAKLTPQGPVCPSCRVHFANYKICEVCGASDRTASRMRRLWGDKIVCAKCARSDQKSCSQCGRYRRCEPGEDGRPTCTLCRTESQRPCKTCGILIPPGLGVQCRLCKERHRLRHLGYGLAELLTTHECRDAFREYVDWLYKLPDPARLVRLLSRHVEFFVEVERREITLEDSDRLLRELGTPFLRRYLLVTRWLQEERLCEIGKKQRAKASDEVRLRKAVNTLPEGSEEKQAAEQFMKELSAAVSAGDITHLTARLSIRPAVDLLKKCQKKRPFLLTQDDLVAYLREKPGQRAAIARFVGFFRRNFGVNLVLPKSNQLGKLPFSGSDEAVRAHLMVKIRDAQFERDWMKLMLVHLHRLSERSADKVISKAEVLVIDGGCQCRVGPDTYWLPAPPKQLIKATHR